MVNLCRQGAEDRFNQGWFLRWAASLKENLALDNDQSCDKKVEDDDDVYISSIDLNNDQGFDKQEEDDDVYICSLKPNNDRGFDKEEEDDECWTMILVLKRMMMMRMMMMRMTMCTYVHYS